MLRVMLVDDEPFALEGLKLLINWQSEGFDVCAECSGGAEALNRLPVDRPDLIVTDIRMAGIDGLELISSAKRQGYNGQFVIVSGYGDFEYAKRALSLGAAGYLLRPVEPEEASTVLTHVRRRLIDRETTLTKKRASISQAVSSLLCGMPADAIPAGGWWRMATWGAPLCYEDGQRVLSIFSEGAASACILDDKEYLVVHWQDENAEPEWETVKAFLKERRRQLLQSERTDDPSKLAALRSRLAAQLDTSCCALAERVAVLTRAVALRQSAECQARCAELETFCTACGADAMARARQQLVTECARQFAQHPERFSEFLTAQHADLEAICTLAIRLLAPEQERLSDRVTEYVKKHAEERLTVESVASALGYNATYLGRVFRDETGTAFREWLAALRIERATLLLCRTDECVGVIAERVGYSQYKRFLKHFKRRYGLTPEQYRRQHTASPTAGK
jgi:two-component system, response regulator YesN